MDGKQGGCAGKGKRGEKSTRATVNTRIQEEEVNDRVRFALRMSSRTFRARSLLFLLTAFVDAKFSVAQKTGIFDIIKTEPGFAFKTGS